MRRKNTAIKSFPRNTNKKHISKIKKRYLTLVTNQLLKIHYNSKTLWSKL